MTASPIRAVLFDLDGTLIDTAADLLGALDDVRAELDLPACAHTLPAAVAARGGRGILALGFPDDAGVVDRLLPRYLALYAERIARFSRPYDGIEALLAALRAREVAIGIVTNKPEGLARSLLAALDWNAHFDVLVGGDTLSVRKPAPEPVLHAAAALGLTAGACAMVGDDRRDIESGRAAGCALNVAVAYGYIEVPQELPAWRADHCVQTPQQLATLLLELTDAR